MKEIVVKKPEPPVATEVIADAIIEIATGVKKMRAGRLNGRALLLLIQSASGVSQKNIKAVLDGIESLQRNYIK